MNTNMKLLQKKIKVDTIVLCIICILFAISIMSNIGQINEYSRMNKSSFEVKLGPTDTVNNTNNYYLYIEGEKYWTVDYNNYSRLDDTGKTNAKANLIMDNVNEVLKSIIIEIIFIFLYIMLSRVKKGLTPFSVDNVSILRIIAFLSFFLALLPVGVNMVGSMIAFQYATIYYSPLNFYIIAIGVVFGIISEIFKYGCELQEDMNQIA
ncbi:DUF2975 domain-containing protein [[Clostridium] fimetarium]|uniref:DUF2975 domain-containing protein n=1 Tax=[Clostridium] fimetarium TaxID=99656 RepID=A0A1I0R126_9FIRM|nr:DUF2975 domain-containing protein [[Clostridium] fimetarium]SEW34128.1 Protein of unknown function [[Clostridium] fimetarium]